MGYLAFYIGPLRCLGDVGTASVVYMVFFPCLLGYCHEDVVEVSTFIKLQQRFRVFEANVGNMFAMSVGLYVGLYIYIPAPVRKQR